MENRFIRLLNFLRLTVVGGVLLLTPVFFLPVTNDWFEINKQALVVTGAFAGFIILLIEMVVNKTVIFKKAPLDLPLILFLAALVSSAFLAISRYETIRALLPLLACFLFYFVLLNSLKSKNEWRWLFGALVASLGLTAAFPLIQFFGAQIVSLAKITSAPFWLSSGWSPVGSVYSQALYLAILLPLPIAACFRKAFALSYSGETERIDNKTVAFLSATALAVIALVLAFIFLRKAAPVFLDYKTSWAIVTAVLRDQVLTGVGAGNFISEFTRNKPLSFNLTPYWNLRFGSAGSEWLNLIASAGLFGFGAFLFLLTKTFKFLKRFFREKFTGDNEIFDPLYGLTAGLAVLVLSQIFLPSPFIVWYLFFVLLAFIFAGVGLAGSEAVSDFVLSVSAGVKNLPKTQIEDEHQLKKRIELLSWALLVLSFVFSGIFLYRAGRIYLGEVYFQKALEQAMKNDGRQTYNNLQRAISFNRENPGFYVSLSQTNLLIADNLASRQELTDQDKLTIQQLIRQSVDAAKTAVQLSPLNVGHVENLGVIYRNLLNVAEGSDAWGVAAYNTAINLDPANPRLRLDLGGIYYSLKDWTSAANNFSAAVQLKPDYANARYNLAQALKSQNAFEAALRELTIVKDLICAAGESADCKKISEEIDEVKTKVPAPTPAASAAASEPTAPPSPTVPTILPSPVASPLPILTPTPKPTSVPTPSPTP